MIMEYLWKNTDREKLKYWVTWTKPVPVPLSPPKIPHTLAGDQTQASIL
jgi:hypothetical protein